MDTASAVRIQSPVAAAFAPTTRCDICDAPVHRTEIVDHTQLCAAIERGLSLERRPVVPCPGDLVHTRHSG